jgi:hypothetical protein
MTDRDYSDDDISNIPNCNVYVNGNEYYSGTANTSIKTKELPYIGTTTIVSIIISLLLIRSTYVQYQMKHISVLVLIFSFLTMACIAISIRGIYNAKKIVNDKKNNTSSQVNFRPCFSTKENKILTPVQSSLSTLSLLE